MATMDEIEKAIIENWNHLGTGILDPYWADDATYDAGGPARGSHYEGKAAIKAAGARAIGQMFKIEKVTIHRVIRGKDAIVVQVRPEGTSRKTGRPYANELCYIYTVKDGKLVHQYEYLDTISSARACGDMPYPS